MVAPHQGSIGRRSRALETPLCAREGSRCCCSLRSPSAACLLQLAAAGCLPAQGRRGRMAGSAPLWPCLWLRAASVHPIVSEFLLALQGHNWAPRHLCFVAQGGRTDRPGHGASSLPRYLGPVPTVAVGRGRVSRTCASVAQRPQGLLVPPRPQCRPACWGLWLPFLLPSACSLLSEQNLLERPSLQLASGPQEPWLIWWPPVAVWLWPEPVLVPQDASSRGSGGGGRERLIMDPPLAQEKAGAPAVPSHLLSTPYPFGLSPSSVMQDSRFPPLK